MVDEKTDPNVEINEVTFLDYSNAGDRVPCFSEQYDEPGCASCGG